MAGVGGRPARPIAIRASLSHKIFLSVVFTLLFIAALSVFLSTSPSNMNGDRDPALGSLHQLRPYMSRTFLALKSDPLRIRLDLITKQATDHIALVNAYSSYARKLKIDNSRLLRTFLDVSSNFTSIIDSYDQDNKNTTDTNEDAVRALEKDVKDRAKLARLLISESKEPFDTNLKIQKLRDTIFAVKEQLNRAKKLGATSSAIAAGSTPKSLHCLAMRLVDERVSNGATYVNYYKKLAASASVYLQDPDLYHYAIFSDNVIAVSVVVNSVIKNADEPKKLVFHIVTDRMNLAAFQVWFMKRKLPLDAKMEVQSIADFEFLKSSYAPIISIIEDGRWDLNLLEHLKFYLPQMYPKLHRIVYLEDDVVVQSDLASLWKVDLEGRVNGAVEMCFGPFKRFTRYVNFSSPVIRERFNPKACAWGFGVNVFDLDVWRRDKLTGDYHKYMELNKDSSLWDIGKTLPVGLMTFYGNTKSLEKTWHVMGLGYNPSISLDEIGNAAVIHFNGDMKPWLDVAMNQYKNLWMKYVDSDMEYLQLCNFGI
ncbi:putative galacturonosyltransferase 9 [Zostera marina]|uniref:Hexosyltransferase n=1 Tax=Zostera marina TaxID=29655 RepID=A0A0K9NK66_ZOSMR|nr:putative galacturonosyltransferase 9 [Zostera marina]